MEDLIFKTKYQKYKYRVKVWEKDFKQKHGRIPSKYDIRDARQDIRDSYKMYYKLKTSLLENTLSDALSEDGFDLFDYDSSQGETSFLLSENDTSNVLNLPNDLTLLTSCSDSSFSNINEIKKNTNHEESPLTNVINVNDDHVISEFHPVNVLPSNNSAWIGNIQPTVETVKLSKSPPKQPFKSNLNSKLFNSSFSKRNPRKSLSRLSSSSSNITTISSSGSLLNENGHEKEALPDLETILTQKAKEQQNTPATVVLPTNILKTNSHNISTHVDRRWLDRIGNETGGDISLEMTSKTVSLTTNNENDTNKTYGLSNINNTKLDLYHDTNSLVDIKDVVATEINAYEHDSDEIVANSEDETGTNESQYYRHVVKRRRILLDIDKNQTNVPINEIVKKKPDIQAKSDPLSETNEKEENILKISTKKTKRQTTKKVQHKNGTKIEDSCDSKPSVKQKLKQTKKNMKSSKKQSKSNVLSSSKTKSKKKNNATIDNSDNSPESKLDNTLPPDEQSTYNLALDVGNLTTLPSVNIDHLKHAEEVFEKYMGSTKTNVIIGKKVKKLPEETNDKNEAAKALLRDKVSTGKLNENFVRINVNKKVFVRGKKAFNFSKHKKKLWRHQKKISALSGPDMDMGGCDGGVLKCFNCGQVGHFAQKCKMKGDSLAPFDPDAIDDSPFPTLDEAEIMAAKQALSVHSSNIQKMPEASNKMLVKKNDNETEYQDNNSSNDSDDIDEFADAFEEDFILESDEENNITEEVKETPVETPYIGHKIPEEFLKQAGLLETSSIDLEIKPLYDLKPNGSVIEPTEDVLDVLKMFGHSNFRKGQDRAIMRILSGQSTLVTLSTGSGKSLCYQLPAYLYSRERKGITLVISPLVSLMEDQVYGVADFLRAYCLHTNQTPQQRIKILEVIDSGEIDILLVSPEAVVAGEKSTGFGSLLRKLPPIAFACIDEAHCVSQWSHNFRPSYLMICKVLQQNLGVKTILGLTATATLPTRKSIIQHLRITDGMAGVISDIPLPDNLILSISKDANRDNALMQLLRSERFDVCQSIIIYCTRRDECERIAGFIRTCMQDKAPGKTDTKNKRKRINWHAEPYHAGMVASRRRTIQKAFMQNELRIVVATIAFGMGINKPDIRSVIHYNMPKNFESYVQEVGRAGRDGKLAHCHLFLDSKGSDQNELRRHIYANSIDRHVIRKLLQKVFIPCSCNKNINKIEHKQIEEKGEKIEFQENFRDKCKEASNNTGNSDVWSNIKSRKRTCPGHEIGFSVESTVLELDIPEENIATLLCYLELDDSHILNVLSNAYTMCKVICYGGGKKLKQAARDCPPLAMAIAMELKKGSFDEEQNIIEFSVIDIASAIGWNSGVVKYQLKNLEWIKESNSSKRSTISVSYYNLGFRLRAPGDFLPEEIDETLDSLYSRSVQQEKAQLIQLQYVFEGLSSNAFGSCHPCCEPDFNKEKSDQLKAIIRDYFQNDYPKDMILTEQIDNTPDDLILSDARTMINMYPDNNFTGRTLARIFHGIQSPNYPAVIWGRCKYWRAHTKCNFNRIVNLTNSLIVKMRT